MKKQIKKLRLSKESISSLEELSIKGGAPTTGQSQYCPVPLPFPQPVPHTNDPVICYTRSCNSICPIC